jgi:hypothetical protein
MSEPRVRYGVGFLRDLRFNAAHRIGSSVAA